MIIDGQISLFDWAKRDEPEFPGIGRLYQYSRKNHDYMGAELVEKCAKWLEVHPEDADCWKPSKILKSAHRPDNVPPIIEALNNELVEMFGEAADDDYFQYNVWEHVPTLGNRYWLSVGNQTEWDINEIIDRYKAVDLDITVSACPDLVNDNGDELSSVLYISTLWKTKGHKDNMGPAPKKTVQEPPFDRSILKGIKGIDEIIGQLPKYRITLKNPDYAGRVEKTAVWVGYFHSISDSGWNYKLDEVKNYSELDKKDCIFSRHTCNKNVLWEVAKECGTKCPHKCCRQCDVRLCGARCNGSEEPKAHDWIYCSERKPDKSGYYTILDINGATGRAWFEKIRGDFDHVTGYAVQGWEEQEIKL